jgi:hypothetical protein
MTAKRYDQDILESELAAELLPPAQEAIPATPAEKKALAEKEATNVERRKKARKARGENLEADPPTKATTFSYESDALPHVAESQAEALANCRTTGCLVRIVFVRDVEPFEGASIEVQLRLKGPGMAKLLHGAKVLSVTTLPAPPL